MTEKEAIIILTYYNDWRMGEDIPMQKPAVITEALKTIIQAYYKNYTNKYMETTIKHELLASLMLKVIDENKEAQESVESEEWKLGYHEAVDMVLEFLNELNKQK